MTKAKLTTWINWDSDGTGIGAGLPGPNATEIDINVEPGDEPVGITITSDAITMTSKVEPKFVTIPDPPSPANLVYPDNTVEENVRRVLDALRNGSNMTRANIAFSDLLTQLNVTEPQLSADENEDECGDGYEREEEQ